MEMEYNMKDVRASSMETGGKGGRMVLEEGHIGGAVRFQSNRQESGCDLQRC